jgi:hypothetical protein
MADAKHLERLRRGSEVWNLWRQSNPDIRPDLIHANLNGLVLEAANLHKAVLARSDLSGAMLSKSDLSDSDLSRTDLGGADLNGSNLSRAHVVEADLSGANLRGVSMRSANLSGANLRNADLTNADLSMSDLTNANFSGANLRQALFANATVGWTTFGDNDLSLARGLDRVEHRGPSEIGISCIYQSKGNIPEIFLRGSGVPNDLIVYLPSLVNALDAIQFYSCFISYSHKDEDFAKRLHSSLQGAHIRVWYAPEDIRGGVKLYEQIDTAIRYHDKVLIVLSEHSMQSEWVMTEIRRTRRHEINEGRRKLFPIRLVDVDTIKQWECFDADSGKDLAIEVREYFIPDFSSWKDQKAFDSAFSSLLRDLRNPGEPARVPETPSPILKP